MYIPSKLIHHRSLCWQTKENIQTVSVLILTYWRHFSWWFELQTIKQRIGLMIILRVEVVLDFSKKSYDTILWYYLPLLYQFFPISWNIYIRAVHCSSTGLSEFWLLIPWPIFKPKHHSWLIGLIERARASIVCFLRSFKLSIC